MFDTARIFLLGIAALLPSLGMAAGATEDIASCRSLTDNAARLACFDRLTTSDRIAPSPAQPSVSESVKPTAPPVTPSLPATAAKPVAPATQPRAEDFGAEAVRPPAVKQPKALTSRVVGKVNGVRAGTIFKLDNGQIWKSIDDHQYDAEGDSPEVTIDRNFVGTYWMALTKLGYRFRVRRVQ